MSEAAESARKFRGVILPTAQEAARPRGVPPSRVRGTYHSAACIIKSGAGNSGTIREVLNLKTRTVSDMPGLRWAMEASEALSHGTVSSEVEGKPGL
eukprot:335-Hanusia_phi.AAC.1